MILVFKVLAVMFMIIGIFATFTLLAIAIQSRIEDKRMRRELDEKLTIKYYDFDEHEMADLGLHNKQLDILNKSIEEHLREKYDIPKIEIPDECVGCMFGKRFVNDGDEDNILVCLKCRRTYVEGSECYEEYPDRYIAEEEE